MGRTQPADVNHETFSDPRTRGELEAEGWCDPGERAVLLSIADRVRGGRLLDVGLGTGRTTAILRRLSDDYVGVDYSPGMVAAARERHPGVDIRQGDARDLTGIPSGSVDLVLFSYNGIDAVDHDDRQLVLAEFRRVLRPGGLLVYSTLNGDGPAARERPWRLNPPLPWHAGTLQAYAPSLGHRLAAELKSVVHHPGDRVIALRNWSSLRRRSTSGDGWRLAPMGAHRFGLLVHFTGRDQIDAELLRHGFVREQLVGSDTGLPVDDQGRNTEWWFHVIARRG
jgi:SAM-dependent methyltransferase